MKRGNVLKLISTIVLCQLVGGAGSIFTAPAISGWYANLAKPFFNPPNWIFAPVWTFLFLLMGISLYFILRNSLRDKKVRLAVFIFSFQLALNLAWSFLFFGRQDPFFAFLEIIILWLAILATILQFWKIEKKAAYLLLPYLIWVSFAAFLNFSIWQLNI